MIKKRDLCNADSCFMCNNCTNEWKMAIRSHKANFKVKKGEVIFSEGDEFKGIFFVISGNVKVFKNWDDDKELIIRFANNGAILGHRGMGGKPIYPISATALEPSILCFIDIPFFEATLKANPEFTYQLLTFFSEELRDSERKMRNLAHMPVKGRVAEALVLLQKQFGVSEEGFINIDLSRQDLASYAGATYETVFRMINELVADGYISLTGKRIAIENMEGLSVISQSTVTA
jgi:CRP-like cAMP-binding protein